ncbi:MAG: sensor histidine kinase [Acidimicrobiales bacterium]
MRAPLWTRSARFRLTLTYSLALFLVGALVLGAIYVGLSRALDDEPITRTVITQGLIPSGDGGVTLVTAEFEAQFRSVESLANERALESLRTWSFGALAAMFGASLFVGWFVAGWVLRPVGRITAVARDIQATDLSRRIALEGPDDEITRLADTFDAMIGRLDRAFEGQRRFVHEASHELRNPLATIRTNLEVALADPNASADDLRQTAEVVDRTTERMGAVVDDLLAFAHSEMPERELVATDVSLLVEDVVEEFAGAAEAAAVSIAVEGSGIGEMQVEPTPLRRAVANLLSNAIEHSPSGTTVRVAVDQTPDRVSIAVEDQGPGVAGADAESVFRRGWRGARSRDSRPSGSGLGLTIVRQVAESHGGAATVTRAEGGGARFSIELPAAVVQAAVGPGVQTV